MSPHIDSTSQYIIRDGPGWFPNGPKQGACSSSGVCRSTVIIQLTCLSVALSLCRSVALSLCLSLSSHSPFALLVLSSHSPLTLLSSQAPIKYTRSASGKLLSEVPFHAALINGKGRTNSTRSNNLTIFRIPQSASAAAAAAANTGGHCFRIVASQMGLPLQISVDGHVLTVFAADGHAVDPVVVDSVVIEAGETFDISARLLSPTHSGAEAAAAAAHGDGNSFWVRAKTLDVGFGDEHMGLAILQYDGAAVNGADPTSVPIPCTATHRCKVMNCPFPSLHPSMYSDCLGADTLRGDTSSSDWVPVAPATAPTDETMFLNFVFEPAINNRRFIAPQAPPLTQPRDARLLACDDAECAARGFPHEPCECTHNRAIPFNTTVTAVLTNLGIGAFGLHPVHLHGHSFHVLKVVYPPVYNDTKSVCKWPEGDPHPTCLSTDDIVCLEGSGFGANCSFKPGREPVLNLDRPPLKDTVVVPAGGYTVIRFKADNPGACEGMVYEWGA